MSRMIRTIGLVVSLAAAPVWANETVERTLEMPADGRVSVENMAGNVEIEAWDRAEARVVVEPGDEVEEVEIDALANGIRVYVRNRGNNNDVDGSDVVMRVPRGAQVEVNGISTDVSVKGIKNSSILIETISGELEVEADTDQLELSAVSGDISFDGAASRVTAETVSGDVVLVGVSGEVQANVVSGDVTVEASSVNRARFEGVSGDISLDLSVADGGRLSCDSMSGEVVIRLPAGQEGEFTAQSFSGSISSDFGEVSQVSRGSGEVLKHREGSSSASIRVESFSGDISIRKQ